MSKLSKRFERLTSREHLLGLHSFLIRLSLRFWRLFRLGNHIREQLPQGRCSIFCSPLGERVLRMNRHWWFLRQLGMRIRWQLLRILKNYWVKIIKNWQQLKHYLHSCILELDQPTYRHELHDRRPSRVSIGILRLLRPNSSRKRRTLPHLGRYHTGVGSDLLKLVVLFCVGVKGKGEKKLINN